MRRTGRGRQVEAGCGAVLVGQHRGLGRAQRLEPDPRAQGQTAPGKALRDGAHDFLVMHESEPQPVGHHIAGDVVRRRPEPAGHEQDLRARRRLDQRLADDQPIRNGDLPSDPQPERKERLGEEPQVGVEDVAEQQLGPGIDDFDVHGWKMAWTLVRTPRALWTKVQAAWLTARRRPSASGGLRRSRPCRSRPPGSSAARARCRAPSRRGRKARSRRASAASRRRGLSCASRART